MQRELVTHAVAGAGAAGGSGLWRGVGAGRSGGLGLTPRLADSYPREVRRMILREHLKLARFSEKPKDLLLSVFLDLQEDPTPLKNSRIV